jgi:hypothetical protein
VEFKQLKLDRIKNGIRELFVQDSNMHERGTQLSQLYGKLREDRARPAFYLSRISQPSNWALARLRAFSRGRFNRLALGVFGFSLLRDDHVSHHGVHEFKGGIHLTIYATNETDDNRNHSGE